MALDSSITAALASLRSRRDALDRAIAALVALDDGDDVATATHDTTSAPENPVSPLTKGRIESVGGGAAGARKVLRNAPGRGYTAAQLAEAMFANGWVTPSKNPRTAARAAANRLREDSAEHVFFEDGHFVYRPPSGELDLHATTQGNGGA